MKDYLLSRLTTALWTLIVITLVSLAAYASFGRLLVENVERYQQDLLRELNARLEFVVEVDSMRGSWTSFTPRLEITGMRMLTSDDNSASLEIDEVYGEVDVLDTLLSGRIQFYALVSSGVRADLDVDAEGQLSLRGLPGAAGDGFANPLYDFVFNSERLGFKDVSLSIHDGEEQYRVFVEAELSRDQAFRRFTMSLLSPSREAWFNVQAEGEGDLLEFSDFNGVFHLETHLGQLAAYAEFLTPLGLLVEAGSADAELWVELTEGRAEVAAEISASDLQVAKTDNPGRSYRADSVDGTLRADYQDGRWNFAMKDLALLGQTESFQLPGLIGQYDDSELMLRAGDIDIERLVRFLNRGRFLEPGGEELLDSLAPSGRMETLQFTLVDSDNWNLEGNFSSLKVSSRGGAPGVKNASGYLNMGPQQGRVQLASSDFSLEFPTIYREALSYQDFAAELAWQLEEDVFRIYSGPFTGRDDEGAVHGLFALRIPLEETAAGIEMDLVVGLTDTHPVQRNKYLPFTLSQGLLDWLSPAIGEGKIREGGFLWRGSLGQPDLRTVILFFEIEDTQLDYHPDWPPLDEVSGLVLIDGANVDVQVESARILDSRVSDVAVSLRKDERSHLMLAVTADMTGSAGDGLQIVNESPLRAQIGDSFVDWSLQGGLQTRLDLLLDLTAPATGPRVKVETEWNAVQIDTGSLGLVVNNVNGSLLYTSEQGFSSTQLSGNLWQQPVRAEIRQGRKEGGLAELDIGLYSLLEIDSLQDWLQLDVLNLARGAAATEMHIVVAAGEPARAEISSDLQGVSLDLPPPWGKPADQASAMSLTMPLAGLQRRLQLELEQELFLGLLLDSQGLVGGSLGFGAPLVAEEPGQFLLGGSVGTLQWDTWSQFVDSYILTADESAATAPAAGLLLGARDLQIHELDIFGQRVHDLRLNAEQQPESWLLDVELAWLKGRVTLPSDISRVGIVIDSLNLAGLDTDLAQGLDQIDPGELSLPPIDVAIAALGSGEQVWGDLSFKFAQLAKSYRFEDIRGNLRGLQMGDTEGMTLEWFHSQQPPETRLDGELVIGDLGDVLADFSYERVIETSGGSFALNLDWPGSPLEFELAAAVGEIDIDIGEGSFLKTSGATSGTLRVVSILNLAEFVRRLSLDLSYMFQSGVPFDSIKGTLDAKGGLLEIPGLDVTGRSSKFQFVGVADVPAQTVDINLVATLPIASNLPWIAALVSGLPAAAAIYVISKLFTKQMDRFSSATYQIKGPWDDPTVKFQSIFDDAATTPSMPADAPTESAATTDATADKP